MFERDSYNFSLKYENNPLFNLIMEVYDCV